MLFLLKPHRLGLGMAAALLVLTAQAQSPSLKVEAAWARASVPGQMGTGAFMTLTAAQNLKLVGVSSPVAGVAELHEMKMDGEVMRMRAVESLDLPAGKPVEFKPGGYHLMLMELKQVLRKDTQVPLTLSLRNAQGQLSQVQVSVPVALQPPTGAPTAPTAHKH